MVFGNYVEIRKRKKKRTTKKSVADQDKLIQAAKKKKRSLKSTKSANDKIDQMFVEMTGHPKETRKNRVFNMILKQGEVKVLKDDDAKHGLTLASGKYVSIAEQKVHTDFVTRGKRKQVLLKQFIHDSKLLANNHASKRYYYEIELLKTTCKIAELYRDLTSARFDLCLREEFNALSLFRHFDRKQKGVFGLAEAELSLAEFGMFPHRSDLCLTLKSFDRQSKARLNYEDFCGMIIPKDKEFRSMMIDRIKLDTADMDKVYMSTISEDTFNALTRFFSQLITYSVCTEALKQRLIHEVGIDLNAAFGYLPKGQKSLLAGIDLDRLYKARNIPIAYRDIAEFIKCYDLDCDGKLNYTEFVKAFTPQMTVAYK